MISSSYILSAMLIALLLDVPALADDMIVDGKSCNTLCQSWLGIKAPSVAPSAAVAMRPEPLPRRTRGIETHDQAALPTVAYRPASDVKALQPRRLASRRALPGDVDPHISASVSTGTMNQFLSIPASLPVRAPRPEAIDTTASVAPPSSLQNDVVATQEPAFDNEIDPELETPAGPHIVSRRRPRQVSRRDQASHAASMVELPMEPGLKGLPRLSELVAVRGSIIAETSQEQASNAALRSKMMKATSRPHDVAAPGPDVSSPAVSAAGMN